MLNLCPWFPRFLVPLLLAPFIGLAVAASPVRAATNDLDICADERVKTTVFTISALTAAEAACSRVLANASGDAERQKAAFFRGLMRFLRVVQAGAEKAAQPDGSIAYAPPALADLRAALKDIQHAVALEGPMKGDALALRATINQTIGRNDDARADIDQALQASPDEPTPFVQRALDRQRAGDVGGALADLDQALKLDPEAGTALWARGDLQQRLGLLGPARADLAAAAALGPPFRRLALTQKSEVELRSGDLRAAFDDLLAASREKGDLPEDAALGANADLLVRAGDLALDKLKEPDAAEKLYRDAAKLARANWGAQLGLARVEEQRGERSKAIAIYKRILAATQKTPQLYERMLAAFRLRALTHPLERRALAPFQSGLDVGVAASTGSPDGLKRVAFVIGEGDYAELASLPNARRDAAVVANALAEIGFDTIEIADNLNKTELRSVPEVIAAAAAQADVVLVYYAGHGVETAGVNYLIPVDAAPESDEQLQTDALALADLTAAAAKARHGALVIIDACRDDPFVEARSVALSRGAGTRQAVPGHLRTGLAATPTPPPNNVVFHSTQPGQTALDGEGLESPFLRALLGTLTTPGRPLEAVVQETTARVVEQTNGRQVPTSYGAAPSVALLPLAPRR
jgi:tetratricopeptide (TPR) repeat protein